MKETKDEIISGNRFDRMWDYSYGDTSLPTLNSELRMRQGCFL